MLYVSVRGSRLHSDTRRRSVGRMGRIVAILPYRPVLARSDTSRMVVGWAWVRRVGEMMHGGTPAGKSRLDSLVAFAPSFHLDMLTLISYKVYYDLSTYEIRC